MRRRATLDALGETVRAELDRVGSAPASSAGLAAIVAAWPGSVGSDIARNAFPARMTREGVLIVHVSSSTWAFELTQLEDAVLARLGELAPPRLRFVVGPIPEPAAEPVPEVRRSIPRPEPDASRRGAEIARPIEDPELRSLVSRAASASLARSAATAGSTGRSDTIRTD